MMDSNRAWTLLSGNHRSLQQLNDFLDKNASASHLNESFLECTLAELDEMDAGRDRAFWVTIARINELALFCAGNYADACELSLVGDLLVNPRRVVVHVRGQRRPIVKERHTPLSEQFRGVAETHRGIVEWLLKETVSEIKAEAVLPELYSRLERCGHMTEEYLASVRERKILIAKLVGLMVSGRFKDGGDFVGWLKSASDADREFMESSLCRFDLTRFFEMGLDVRRTAESHSRRSGLLAARAEGAIDWSVCESASRKAAGTLF